MFSIWWIKVENRMNELFLACSCLYMVEMIRIVCQGGQLSADGVIERTFNLNVSKL